MSAEIDERLETVLLVHSYYRQRGGEDEIVETEQALLEARGHKVLRYLVHNRETQDISRLGLAASAVWSGGSYRRLRRLIRRERPDVVQFHNTLPLISPAGYWAAAAEGALVIQNIQNYRLICPGSLLLRDGAVCELCVGRSVPWPGVRYACYRDSHAATAVVALKLATHRALGTWRRKVDVYMVPNRFIGAKLVQGGIPSGRIEERPNLIEPDPGVGRGGGGFALFAGRLVAEKGVDVLLDAWARLRHRLPLRLVGDGPMAGTVARAAETPGIEWLGFQDHDRVLELMRRAELLVVPSIWFEASPMTIGEAFATGLPVVGSDHGGMASLIDPGRTGLLFPPGDAAALATCVEELLDAPERLARMRREARREYELRYSAEPCYRRLREIYRRRPGRTG